jgi:hypothetical protein
MAIIVVGGHAQKVGKSSVVAGLIARLPEREWTAVKITQSGHCGDHGQAGDLAMAIHVERDPTAGTDSARFLAAGARKSIWMRTRAGHLGEVMPRIRQEIAGAANVIFESNSVLEFLRPDLYLMVLDGATVDFKESARRFLGSADAVLWRASPLEAAPRWEGVSLRLIAEKPQFLVTPPDVVAEDLVSFVRRRLKD